MLTLYSAPISADALTTTPVNLGWQIPVHLGFFKQWFKKLISSIKTAYHFYLHEQQFTSCAPGNAFRRFCVYFCGTASPMRHLFIFQFMFYHSIIFHSYSGLKGRRSRAPLAFNSSLPSASTAVRISNFLIFESSFLITSVTNSFILATNYI